MADTSPMVTTLLREVLERSNPALGATLKQRLNAELQARGEAPLDERALGFKKFRDFVTAQPWLVVSTAQSGDIMVSLRDSGQNKSDDSAPNASASASTVQSEVWQAFTNPDPSRRRFLNRRTGNVKHFLEGEESPEAQEVAAKPDEFVEIRPIPGEQHVGWMRGFLDTIAITDAERSACAALLDQPYSSGLNLTFTRALGKHAVAWREFRTTRITDWIKQWSDQQGVPNPAIGKREGSAPLQAPVAMSDHLTARAQAVKLLDLLSEQDIAKVVMPVLLTTLLIKAKG